MSIRFKKFRSEDGAFERQAIKITEKNIDEVVAYIQRNGGSAFVTAGADGKPRRIRIKQRNFGRNWGKRDWRVAVVGDYIVKAPVRSDFVKVLGKTEFWREKGAAFDFAFNPVK